VTDWKTRLQRDFLHVDGDVDVKSHSLTHLLTLRRTFIIAAIIRRYRNAFSPVVKATDFY